LNSKVLAGVLVLCIVVLAVVTAGATTFRTETFALRGTGSFMSHPPIFAGYMIAGTLNPGTFWVAFNETGWPVDDPGTPQNERWDYIFAHYFHYVGTVGSEGWDGYFPPVGSGEPMPRWHFVTAAGDTLGGSCTQVIITIRDYDADGVVDANEYAAKVISGNMVDYINYNGGCYRNFCGNGNFSGTLRVLNAETWEEEWYVPSETSASGRLYLRDGGCTVGVESGSWGRIKSIYR
jgi:hypothetical protein